MKNFLEYVDSGYYDGTLFHRVIPGFMVQTGGFSAGMQEKKTRAPIKNEADNGLLNERGTSPWPVPEWSIRPPASSSST